MSYWNYDYKDNPSHDNNRKRGMIDNDPSKHYPGKREAKLLRKLKKETGMTEEEIRSHKKYRIMLSDAQKEETNPKTDEVTKTYRYLIKLACKETGLAPPHPKTLKALQKIIDAQPYGFWWLTQKPTAEEVVRNHTINK